MLLTLFFAEVILIVKVEFKMLAAAGADHFALFKHTFIKLNGVAAGRAANLIKLFIIFVIKVVIFIIGIIFIILRSRKTKVSGNETKTEPDIFTQMDTERDSED